MTNDDYNRWAHEILGKCWHEQNTDGILDPFSLWPACKHCHIGVGSNYKNPDYCSDLNLAAEVEAKIPKDKLRRYFSALQGCKDSAIGFDLDLIKQLVMATAKQRIQAACWIRDNQEGKE